MAYVKTSRRLLLSYNVAVTPISKIYMQRAARRLMFLIHRNLPFPERATVAPGNKRDKEHHLKLDVVMLALGPGFF
jgi:hypothetical protein